MLENGHFSATEYAQLSGLSYQTVLNYADAGIIPYKLINRHCYFDVESLATGILIKNKSEENCLDIYFVGSDLEEQEVSEPFKFEHSGYTESAEWFQSIKDIADEALLNLCYVSDSERCEYLEKYSSEITDEKNKAIEKYKTRVMKRDDITEEEFNSNLVYKPRLLDINAQYQTNGSEIGDKVKEVINKHLIMDIGDEIKRKIKDLDSNGVFTSVSYDTTDENFNISNFTEQLVKILKGRIYTEVNVHISGTVPSYITDICSKLSELGVLTRYECQ